MPDILPQASGCYQPDSTIKRRVRPMFGFKSKVSTRVILGGIEMVHMMRKGQAKYTCTWQLSPSSSSDSLHKRLRAKIKSFCPP